MSLFPLKKQSSHQYGRNVTCRKGVIKVIASGELCYHCIQICTTEVEDFSLDYVKNYN